LASHAQGTGTTIGRAIGKNTWRRTKGELKDKSGEHIPVGCLNEGSRRRELE
jgi:hypothetical protein